MSLVLVIGIVACAFVLYKNHYTPPSPVPVATTSVSEAEEEDTVAAITPSRRRRIAKPVVDAEHAIDRHRPEDKTEINVHTFFSPSSSTIVDGALPTLHPPLRQSPHATTLHVVPINIPTRGPTPAMQQVGILTNASNDRILALYGRPTFAGSHRWSYHTSTDKFNSIKLPVSHKGRSCTSEHGCDELYDGDDAVVPAYNDEAFKVTLYDIDQPRYIPYV